MPDELRSTILSRRSTLQGVSLGGLLIGAGQSEPLGPVVLVLLKDHSWPLSTDWLCETP